MDARAESLGPEVIQGRDLGDENDRRPYFDVVIRRASDGEERTYRMEGSEWALDDEGNDELFWWTDGNAACDCQRADFFNRAGGDPVNEDESCGHSRYLVMRFILSDGRVVQGPDAHL